MNTPQIALVGLGQIGIGWALHFASAGFRVRCFDKSESAEQAFRRRASALDSDGSHFGEAVTFESSLSAAVRAADFVQESVFESLDVKQAVLQEICALAPRDVLVASSTSSIVPSRLQLGCTYPERVLIGHPFNPVEHVPLVEVVGGRKTSSKSLADAMHLYRISGKKPLLCPRELPGHIANRLQDALLAEALKLIDGGYASPADIDTAISYGPGLRWAFIGPMTIAHLASNIGISSVLLGEFGGIQSQPDVISGLKDTTITYIAEYFDNALNAEKVAAIQRARDAFIHQTAGLAKSLRNEFDAEELPGQPNK